MSIKLKPCKECGFPQDGAGASYDSKMNIIGAGIQCGKCRSGDIQMSVHDHKYLTRDYIHMEWNRLN